MKTALAMLLLLAPLTACGQTNLDDEIVGDEFTQVLDDGREVTCIWVKRGYGGGLSCDWVSAR